jgi:thiamine-phosphate pyrophosphorylase
MSANFEYHLITDRRLQRQPFHEIAQLADEAGIDYFQLREKDLQPAELLKIARHIRPFLVRTKFIINASLDVALAAEADGVHLQKENLPVREIRKRYPALIIGYSAHSLDELKHAEIDGANYIFVSPLFSPISKHSALPAIGCDELCKWIIDRNATVIALGGISVSNLPEVAKAGAKGAAGISLFIKNGYFDRRGMVI